jgi:hypothetical protein
MNIEEKSRTTLKINGIPYVCYVCDEGDGDYSVEVEGNEPPAHVYDVAWEYFESQGFFDGEVDGDGDFGDNT